MKPLYTYQGGASSVRFRMARLWLKIAIKCDIRKHTGTTTRIHLCFGVGTESSLPHFMFTKTILRLVEPTSKLSSSTLSSSLACHQPTSVNSFSWYSSRRDKTLLSSGTLLPEISVSLFICSGYMDTSKRKKTPFLVVDWKKIWLNRILHANNYVNFQH